MQVLETQPTQATYIASDQDFRKEILKMFIELKETMEQTAHKTWGFEGRNEKTSNRNIRAEKNVISEVKTTMESFTSRATAFEDRMGKLEDEQHNTSIQQKTLKKILKANRWY